MVRYRHGKAARARGVSQRELGAALSVCVLYENLVVFPQLKSHAPEKVAVPE